jgi:[acyl-carrier-protein] S-malonyltransferase
MGRFRHPILMTKTAFIFPGQGSQSVGMGVGLAEAFPEAHKAFEQASHILEWDLLEACKNGPEDRLRQTDVAQPALYTTGYAAFLVLRSLSIAPDAVAGHSIGEYAALAAAGVFGFTEGLDLVRERGKLMAAAGKEKPGAMAAVLGLGREDLLKVCQQIQSSHGVCVPVNFNSPEQIVVAGEKAAMEAFAPAATHAGAKRVIPLNVAGAFHSPLMSDAATRMKAQLSRISFRDANYPVAMNVDGQCRQKGSEIQAALAQQLDHSVEWVKSVEALKALGCMTFVECGPGRVLSGLLKRMDKQFSLYSTESIQALDEIKNVLGVARKGTV